MQTSSLTSTTAALGLVGAPADVAEAVASAARGVNGCEVYAFDDVAEVVAAVASGERLAMLFVFARTSDDTAVVRRLLERCAAQKPALAVVVLAESELAHEMANFLSAGAADCLLRPLNLSRLGFLIDFLTLRARTCGASAVVPAEAFLSRAEQPRSAPLRAVQRPRSKPPQAEQPAHRHGNLIYASATTARLFATARRLANVDTTVLLHGETGSGKTCVARLLHELSSRQDEPFVVVNCGALPETLIEGELFGHRQGAYTGADRNHRGKFAQAGQGTLLLDEVDSLSPRAQGTLLRVVEERSFEPLGADRSEQVQARLVFATNRDLAAEVAAGRFRQDLYFRLNVVTIDVPPLRERREEIPALVEAYLEELRQRKATAVQGFSAAALAIFQQYTWPGNLRELKNVVERVAVLCEHAVIEPQDLPRQVLAACEAEKPADHQTAAAAFAAEPGSSAPRGGSTLLGARRKAERQTILQILEQCSDNRSLTAEVLGISRAALYKKLHQLGIA